MSQICLRIVDEFVQSSVDFPNVPMFDESTESVCDVLSAVPVFVCNIRRCTPTVTKEVKDRSIGRIQIDFGHYYAGLRLATKTTVISEMFSTMY